MLQFTEKELVSFGNYLLSDERKKSIIEKSNLKLVTDADISNFKEKLAFTNALDLIAAYSAEQQKSKREEIKIQIDGVVSALPLENLEGAEELLTETGILKTENFEKAIALFTPKALTA